MFLKCTKGVPYSGCEEGRGQGKRVFLKCIEGVPYSGCEEGRGQGKRVFLKCTKGVPYSGCEEGRGQGKRVFLKCTHCKEVFPGAWDLMFHVQNAHSLNIYSLGENNKKVKYIFESYSSSMIKFLCFFQLLIFPCTYFT